MGLQGALGVGAEKAFEVENGSLWTCAEGKESWTQVPGGMLELEGGIF